MVNDRLGDDEWLVRDGAAKVMFFALAWTFAQWKGSGRFDARVKRKDENPDGNSGKDNRMALWKVFEAIEQLLQSTVDPAVRGFGVDLSPNDDDRAGIRALIKQEHLDGITLPDQAQPLWPATQWLLESLAPAPGSKLGESLEKLLGSVLVCATFGAVSGIPPNCVKTAKTYTSEPERREEAAKEGLTKGFLNTAAPVVRMLAGSASSIERTTLAQYDQPMSLDRFQHFPADAKNQASPLPLPVIIRFARLFGFSPVDDEQADPHTLAQRFAVMRPERLKVWNAFCGQNDDSQSLRGENVQTFVKTFEAALGDSWLGPAGQALVRLSPATSKEAKDKPPLAGASEPSPATDTAHTAPQHRDGDIIVNAQSSDDDRIKMTIDSRLDRNRIVLGSIRYRLDGHADAEIVGWRACLVGLVVRWDWQQGIRAELEIPGEYENETAIRNANPQYGVKSVHLDAARLDVEIFPSKPGMALMPDPACAVERLVLPPARLRPGRDAMHSFELRAGWQHVGFLERDANGQEVLHDRSAVAHLIEEQVSASLLLRDYELQLRTGFPDDGGLRRLGVRTATVERLEAIDVIGDRL